MSRRITWRIRLGWFHLILFLFLALATLSANATPLNPLTEFLYLPLIQGYRPLPPPTIFGGEIIPSNEAVVAPLAQQAGVTWTRYVELEWSKVEPTPGARNWDALAGLEASLAARSAAGLTNILVIGDTPTWARQIPTHACSLIKPEALDEFATFMGDLATRYSRPPYYINYFEIYNEPDVDPIYASPTQNFGCWGDEEDPYYGGGYFSQMLSAVYPRIKAGNANAKVVIGGLLLNCDPTHTYPEGRDCSGSKFLRGILQAGNGTNFDVVAYHGYPLHSSNRTDWELDYYLWAHRGGVVLGKLDFIREELAAFNLNKAIFLTEGALLCYEGASCNVEQTLLRQDQANYVVRLYSRAMANDLDAVIWYAVNEPGWRYAGMLDTQLNPLPAYNALTFMTTRLRNATFIGTLGNGVNGVEGYAFRAGNREVRLYWSNNALTYAVPVPTNASLYNKVGNPLPPPTTGIVTVGFEPVYVILP